MSRQQELINDVNVASFLLDEAGLFLNSHPDNMEALEYYHEAQRKRNEAIRCYEEEIGPLSKYSVHNRSYWDWTEGPWPWQGGCR